MAHSITAASTLITGPNLREHYIHSVAFSPNSQILAIGSDDAVRLWDVMNGALMDSFDTNEGWEINFAPDGGILATGGEPIQIWGLKDGKLLREMGGWYHTAFSPNGKLIAAPLSYDRGDVQLWDVYTGNKAILLNRESSTLSQVKSLSFSAEGELLAIGTNNTVEIWQVSTGTLLQALNLGTNRPAEQLIFSPDGKKLSIRSHKSIQIWDIRQLLTR